MNYQILLFVALTCLLGEPAGAAEISIEKPENVGLSSAKLERVSDVMQRRVEENQIAGGVVAIARQGKIVFLKSYGWRDKKADESMKTNSIFRLYSMTKAITTAAAMILVDEGKIALEDPVSKYLPEVANWKVKTPDGLIEPKRSMTIKDLMLHTTGMDVNQAYGGIQLWKARDSNDFVKSLTSVPLAHHPGDEWAYSRSVNLLGFVIEEVSGELLADFLKERLFDPLEMVDTAFHVPVEKRDRFAMVYRREGKPEKGFTLHGPNEKTMEVAVTRFHSNPKVAMGGGGLVGTAEDYLRFLLMIANEGEWDNRRYLSRKSIRLMTTNQLPNHIPNIRNPPGTDRPGIGFGCGFSVVNAKKNFENDAPIGEFGWGGAASTHYWVRPQDSLVVVTMEQVFETNRETRMALRPIIYEAVALVPAQDKARSRREDEKKKPEPQR